MSEQRGDRINIRVGGDVSGQLVAGRGNTTSWTQSQPSAVTQEELVTLQSLFDQLHALIDTEAGDQKTAARDKLDELAEAVASEPPDLATMEHVPGWFRRKLPTLAHAAYSLVVHPIVAKVVAASGDELAAEFTRRFG
jgi:hypothetical protein